MTRAEILDEYRRIIERMKAETTRYNPFDDLLACIKVDAQSLTHFVKMAIAEYPYSPGFWPEVLTFLPIDEWKAIVPLAVAALTRAHTSPIQSTDSENFLKNMMRVMMGDTGKNNSAESVIERACSQCPEELHSFLPQLFEFAWQEITGFRFDPFRNATMKDVDFLWDIIYDDDASNELKGKAWDALLETRNPKFLKRCYEIRDKIDFMSKVGQDMDGIVDVKANYPGDEKVINWAFHQVGYEILEGEVRNLTLGIPWEIQFYLSPDHGDQDRWHPTGCQMPEDKVVEAIFGGESSNHCELCKKKLTYFLRFDSSNYELIKDQGFPEFLEMCLACQNTNRAYGQVQGSRTTIHLDLGKEYRPPMDEYAILKEQKIRLVQKGPRWERHEIGHSGNFFRIGGEPSWVQSAEYPSCPKCDRSMPFLLQYRTEFDLNNGDRLEYEGYYFIFYCGKCGVHDLGAQIS